MTTTKGKIPTQRGISMLLARAGFERSVRSASRIRGMHNHSDGYVVTTGYDDGTVLVRHTTFSWRPVGRDLETIAHMQDRYAETITAAGFTVTREDDGLVVAALKDAEEQ